MDVWNTHCGISSNQTLWLGMHTGFRFFYIQYHIFAVICLMLFVKHLELNILCNTTAHSTVRNKVSPSIFLVQSNQLVRNYITIKSRQIFLFHQTSSKSTTNQCLQTACTGRTQSGWRTLDVFIFGRLILCCLYCLNFKFEVGLVWHLSFIQFMIQWIWLKLLFYKSGDVPDVTKLASVK